MEPILEVNSIHKSFGALQVINDCSIEIRRGSITGLIGPNGAGKTTLFNLIAGTYGSDSGQILYAGEDITHDDPPELFKKGLLRTFQIAQEFSHLTALENLMMVPAEQPGENIFNTWLRPTEVRSFESEVRTKANEVIDFLRLGHVKNELAGNLSGGQKKLLELGRTMMVDAKLVLLDEVAAGVNRTLLNELVDNILRLNRELGYTFFVIEHDMDMIAQLCSPVIVMAEGRKMMEGSIEEIRANPEVVAAYFGGREGLMSLIEVSKLVAGYGDNAPILQDVDMALKAGQIGVIVGPNGAGKSTLLKSIFGLLNVHSGEINLRGQNVAHLRADQLVEKGLAFVPQEFNVFQSMSVEENLEMGAFTRHQGIREMIDKVYTYFPPLKEKRRQAAGELSGGQRQMVAMGRALMADPELLLLDEPTAGLSPLFMEKIFERILAVNDAGVTVLMVEQHAKQALAIADMGFVLVTGQNAYTDTGKALLADQEVARAFLGG